MHEHEIAEKSRFWNGETVNARLSSTFSEEEFGRAAVLVAGLVGEVPEGSEEDSQEASCRLMLDAVKLSEGDLYRLGLWVEAGRRDPRDLIAAAEYRRELADPSSEAREADLVEYVVWASGGSPSATE